MPTGKNEVKVSPFSDEDICIVSKADPCVMWAGTKILYSGMANTSGGWASGEVGPDAGGASGYNYYSGESDIENINCSGWGQVRVPELNQLHQIFVFPKQPTIIGRAAYINHGVGYEGTTGSGIGGCSGKVALIHYNLLCLSGTPSACSGIHECSGYWNSGLMDIIAFGSQF